MASRQISLASEALRYVCGDMGPAEEALFESRLADEPRARQALIAAVQLVAPLEAESGPDLRYRERVRERLQGRQQLRHPGWPRHQRRGQPSSA